MTGFYIVFTIKRVTINWIWTVVSSLLTLWPREGFVIVEDLWMIKKCEREKVKTKQISDVDSHLRCTLMKILLHVGVLFIAVPRWIIQQMILMTKKLAFTTWHCQWIESKLNINEHWTSTHQQSTHLICHLYGYRFIATVFQVPLEINLIWNVKPNHKKTIKQIILFHVYTFHQSPLIFSMFKLLWGTVLALQKFYFKKMP